MCLPLFRQLFVASSPQLAAISAGGLTGFPNVILEQFKAEDSSIHVDLDLATWIGSTHGLAGIPSILLPTIMQWKGRKIAFIVSCLLIIFGWLLIYIATNATTIIIAEFFHGLGGNSLIIVSFFTISEIVDPKYRNVSMTLYGVNQTLGIALVSIIGRYLHWKTVGLIMSAPILMALVLGCVWPESPSWLAWKGEYDKCERAFEWLRGTDEDAAKELITILSAEKEKVIANKNVKKNRRLVDLWLQISRKDFYLPTFHTFVLLCSFYWSGVLVVLIYAMGMIRKATENESAAFYGMIVIDVILFVGTFCTTLLVKFFNNKTVLISSGCCSAVCLVFVSLVTYLQTTCLLPRDSLISVYFLIGFIISSSLGITVVPFTMAAELMPVKHRGLGGALYIIFLCTLHSSSLKLSPYLFLSIDLWGSFLLYALNALLCTLYIWKYVPETKNRTLQEIVFFYNYGCFDRNNKYGDDCDDDCIIGGKNEI